MKIRITFTEGILGTSPQNEDIYTDYIASKAPTANSLEDEIATLGADEVTEKGTTVFHKENGVPFLYDYQVKGFLKSACQALREVSGTKSSKLTSYKKKIDLLIFPEPRKIFFQNCGEMDICERPLRAMTMQGERVSLARSEEIPAGAQMEFEIRSLRGEQDDEILREWLDYGRFNGIGQWRNSGRGRFLWEEMDQEGKVIGGNRK